MKYIFDIVLSFFLFINLSYAEAFTAKVVSVADGDTITVLKNTTLTKIRFDGIDCPENGQDFGNRAKQRTSELVFGKAVEIVPKTTDRYGRTVARIFSATGEDINEKLVGEGLCWWYEKYAPDDSSLRNLQESAKVKHLGLWIRKDATPPWEYRTESKNEQTAQLRAKASESPDNVVFNTKSLKYHTPNCKGAISCTKNCIAISKKDAVARGGVPCKMCGG